MIRFAFVFFSSVTSLILHAQPGIEVSSGYSSYSMKDLSRFLHQQAEASPPVKVTNDFPSNIHFGLRAYHQFDSTQLGIEYTHYLSGGRVHYKDYSGEIGINITTTGHGLGIYTNTILLYHKKFKLKAGIALSGYYSRVDFDQYIIIGNTTDKKNVQTSSWSLGIFPSIEPTYAFSQNFYVGLRGGGLFNTSAQLHLLNDKKAKLQDSNKKPVAAQWSGFRAEFFVGLRIQIEQY